MRKLLLILFIFTTACSTVFSQKIVKNETDDFTGIKIKETSAERIGSGLACQIQVLDDSPILKVTFNGWDDIYTMEEDAEFMFKLENDSIVTLYNMEAATGKYTETSSISHTFSFFLSTKYLILDESLNKLKKYKIVKVRFITTDGYIERNVSKENSKKLLKLFNLI